MKDKSNMHNGVRSYPFHKHYLDMNRREKRAYKRWLNKEKMWDGAIVIENLMKNKNKLFPDIYPKIYQPLNSLKE